MEKFKDGTLSENQQQAFEYIRNNRIDHLFTEMLNNCVQSESQEPIVHMIRYLSTLVSPNELEKENIMIEKKEEIKPSPIIREFYFPDDSTVFLKRFVDPKVFDKLKNVNTTLGGNISHIISTGLKVNNKEAVGIYATDGEAYTKLGLLFKPAVTMLQDYDNNYSLFEIPKHREIFSLGESHIIKERLSAIRLKYSRNLKGYPFIPYAKSHTKREIKEKILNSLRNSKASEKGKFYEMNNENITELENKFFDREENFFSSLELEKEHSGIYLSEDEKVAFLINFNDHLQIVTFDSNCNFREAYKRITNIHKHLTDDLEFEYHSDFGYLTCCPSNVGQGLKISAWLSIPNVVNQGNFLVCCKRWSLRFKKNQLSLGHSADTEIISKHKIGISESSFINAFIVKICSLINYENNLTKNPDFVEKPLEVVKMKESVSSIYITFFEKYKFITTPNLKNFNSLFTLDESTNLYIVNIPDKESFFVFKDFIFDFITGFANINMVETTKDDNLTKLKALYSEKISENDLKIFEDKLADEFADGKLNKICLTIRRNTKKNNFNEVLNAEKIKKNYSRYLSLAKNIREHYEGTVIEESQMSDLFQSDFKFLYTTNAVCAYVSKDDKLLVLFNGLNHIEIISMTKDAKISSCYTQMMKINDYIESKIIIEFDEIFGYLTTHPLNSGCAFEIKFSYENVDFEEYKKKADLNDLSSTKILSTGIEVFNRNKINVNSIDIVRQFMNFISSINKNGNKKDILI